jgi:hypothetical protein
MVRAEAYIHRVRLSIDLGRKLKVYGRRRGGRRQTRARPRHARLLLHRGGQERAAAVGGDAVAVLDEADHAVEVYVAAREH